MLKRIGLQFFADPGGESGEGATETTAENTGTTENTSPETVDYAALARTDTGLQSFLRSECERAVSEYRQGQARTEADRRTEAERLSTMTAEERAAYWQDKYQTAEADRERRENAARLRETTADLYKQNGIPEDLLELIGFENASAEEVNGMVKLLGAYEFHPKGTLDSKVQEAVSERLKQKAPTTGGDASTSVDETLRRAVLGR